jgi:hypothetical protein
MTITFTNTEKMLNNQHIKLQNLSNSQFVNALVVFLYYNLPG